MPHAVIKTGGKQYIVEPGQKLKIEKIGGAAGDVISFEEVLLTADGNAVAVGTPTVKGAKVSAKIEKQGRAKKIMVVKYKPKVRYRKKQGHRQLFTEVTIDSIK